MTAVLDTKTQVRFRVDKTGFADAVSWVARSLPTRPPVPVLGGILMTVDTDGLTVSAFDYEVSAATRVAAETGSDGTVLVSGRLLADIVKSLPNKPVDVSQDGSRLLVSCGAAKFTLPVMPVEDYPQLPTVPASYGTVPGAAFGDAISQVAVAVAKDDTLPMLTGVRMEFTGGTLTVAATDRFRLAVRDIPWGGGDRDPVLVPARTLVESTKTVTDDITLHVGDGLLGVTQGARRSTSRLLDAEFPKFRQLLPTEHTTMVIVPVQSLVDAVKRVALVADRGTQVRLTFTAEGVVVTAGGDDAGQAEEHVPAQLFGEGLTAAFNPQFLVDGVSAVAGDGDYVSIGLTLPNRPAVFRAVEEGFVPAGEGPFQPVDAPYTHLLMPVRIPQ